MSRTDGCDPESPNSKWRAANIQKLFAAEDLDAEAHLRQISSTVSLSTSSPASSAHSHSPVLVHSISAPSLVLPPSDFPTPSPPHPSSNSRGEVPSNTTEPKIAAEPRSPSPSPLSQSMPTATRLSRRPPNTPLPPIPQNRAKASATVRGDYSPSSSAASSTVASPALTSSAAVGVGLASPMAASLPSPTSAHKPLPLPKCEYADNPPPKLETRPKISLSFAPPPDVVQLPLPLSASQSSRFASPTYLHQAHPTSPPVGKTPRSPPLSPRSGPSGTTPEEFNSRLLGLLEAKAEVIFELPEGKIFQSKVPILFKV